MRIPMLLAGQAFTAIALSFVINSPVLANPKVTIYQHNFSGASKSFSPGRYDMGELGIGNDQLSSVKVPKGLGVTLYEHQGFSGRSITFTKDAAYDVIQEKDFNDKTSSILVFKLNVKDDKLKTIFLDPGDSGLDGLKVNDKGGFVGLFGDFIPLPDGIHSLNFDGPRDYNFIIRIEVSRQTARVLDTQFRPGHKIYEVNWSKPIVNTHPEYNDVIAIVFSKIKFGKLKEDRGPLVGASLLPKKEFIILNVDSVPERAEIWIDGEKTKYVTNGPPLSVTYYPGKEKSKRLVIRMSNRVNFIRDLPLSPQKRFDISCELKKPGQ